MAHLQAEWPSQQNILFFLISLFLVPLADTLLAEPSPEIFNWGLHVCAEG